MTAAPTSIGSQRAPLSMTVPWRQPSATETLPASTSNTRPVTPGRVGRAEPRHERGHVVGRHGVEGVGSSGLAMSPAKTCSVMRVRAAGAMALAVMP